MKSTELLQAMEEGATAEVFHANRKSGKKVIVSYPDGTRSVVQYSTLHGLIKAGNVMLVENIQWRGRMEVYTCVTHPPIDYRKWYQL